MCCVLRYFEFCSARSQAPRGGVVVYTQRKYRKIETISLSGCTLLSGVVEGNKRATSTICPFRVPRSACTRTMDYIPSRALKEQYKH